MPADDPRAASDRGAVGRLLARVLAADPPAADGSVTVLPQPPGPVAGILAFTGHHVVAADVDPAWVASVVPHGDFAAPVSGPFVEALAARLGRSYDNLDLVLTASALAGPPSLELVPVDADHDHPRLHRAGRYRRDVRAWQTPERDALVLLGRGLAERWEVAFEVEPGARGRGLGRALATAGRHLVPDGEPLFLQVSPGNVSSLRAVLGAGGFTPIGAEILFPEPD